MPLSEDEEFELLSLERERGGAPAGGMMPPNMGPVAPTPEKTPFADAVRGAGQGMLSFASGIPAAVAGKVAGAVTSDPFFGLRGPHPNVEGAVTKALTYEPSTALGQKTANVLNAPGELYGRMAGGVGNWAEQKSGIPMVGEMARKAIEVAPYGIGRIPGPAQAQALAKAQATERIQPLPSQLPGALERGSAVERIFDVNQPAPVMAAPSEALQRARAAGIKLTPSEGGGGFISRTMESMAGEEKLSKKLSQENVSTAEGMVGRDMPGSPKEINPDSLAKVRQAANEGYAAARGSGNMIADNTLTSALEKAVDKLRQQAESFPDSPLIMEQVKAAENAIKGLDGPVMSADATVSLINNLREKARNAYAGGNAMDKELAPVYRDTANALEAQIERHLIRTKQPPEIIKRFREARTVLAKAYEAERATSTGTLNPQYYGRKFQERGHGGMTGGALQVGEAAAEFPRSMRNPRNFGNTTGPTWADLMLTMASPGFKWDVVTAGARPLMRAGLASDIGQGMIGAPLSPAATQALQYGVAPQAIAKENKMDKR